MILKSCSQLCGHLPKGVEQNICNIGCDLVGIGELVKLLNQTDPDPIFYCELVKECPFIDCTGECTCVREGGTGRRLCWGGGGRISLNNRCLLCRFGFYFYVIYCTFNDIALTTTQYEKTHSYVCLLCRVPCCAVLCRVPCCAVCRAVPWCSLFAPLFTTILGPKCLTIDQMVSEPKSGAQDTTFNVVADYTVRESCDDNS